MTTKIRRYLLPEQIRRLLDIVEDAKRDETKRLAVVIDNKTIMIEITYNPGQPNEMRRSVSL